MCHGATVVDVRGCNHRVEIDVHSDNTNRGNPISIIRQSLGLYIQYISVHKIVFGNNYQIVIKH